MKWLITGASGLLGKAILRRLSRSAELTGLSRSGAHPTVRCDLTNPSQVAAILTQPWDLVIHAAAFSDVDGCEADPERAYGANAQATRTLAALCASRKIPLIHISTDYVFPGTAQRPYAETDPTFPINIYGLTKLHAEHYVLSSSYRTVVVRTSWIFGDGAPHNFVNAVIDRLTKEKRASVLNDQTDCPTYADDLADALGLIANRIIEGPDRLPADRVLHYCNRERTTRFEMTKAIAAHLKLDPCAVGILKPEQLPRRLALRPLSSELSTERYRELFRTEIRPWRQALAEYIERFVLCGS